MVVDCDIAIDCRLRQSTGIGRYIRELVPRVVQRLPNRKFLLIGPTADDLVAQSIGRQAGVEILPTSARAFRLGEQWLYATMARRPHVIWCPHFNIPLLGKRSRLAVTVHDLIPLHIPAGLKGRLRRAAAKVYLRSVASRAWRVFTPTEAVAVQLRREIAVPAERLVVTPLGVRHDWSTGCKTEGGSPPYILYVGNISPHKNVEGLLLAFQKVAADFPHRLILLGEKRGFVRNRDFASLSKMLGDRISVVSRLSDDELRSLITNAQLLVQPSFEEGFGLPPLEAMALGCPVLASDNPALVETTGSAAHRFVLRDTGSLERELRALLVDTALRTSKVEIGRAWTRRFDWDITADITARELDLIANETS